MEDLFNQLGIHFDKNGHTQVHISTLTELFQKMFDKEKKDEWKDQEFDEILKRFYNKGFEDAMENPDDHKYQETFCENTLSNFYQFGEI